jgi:hypothetical protein
MRRTARKRLSKLIRERVVPIFSDKVSWLTSRGAET